MKPTKKPTKNPVKTTKRLPRTPEAWARYARASRQRLEALDTAHAAANARKQAEAVWVAYARERSLARLGVYQDREGTMRWIGNGQPVIGGRRPGQSGWAAQPSAFPAFDRYGHRIG